MREDAVVTSSRKLNPAHFPSLGHAHVSSLPVLQTHHRDGLQTTLRWLTCVGCFLRAVSATGTVFHKIDMDKFRRHSLDALHPALSYESEKKAFVILGPISKSNRLREGRYGAKTLLRNVHVELQWRDEIVTAARWTLTFFFFAHSESSDSSESGSSISA